MSADFKTRLHQHAEHLMRLSWLLFDILNYCKDDENFKRPAKESPPTP